MKFLYPIIFTLLFMSNFNSLHSQDNRVGKLTEHNLRLSNSSFEIDWLNKQDGDRNGHSKFFKKNSVKFDSTSVVDSIITSKSNGDKDRKYIFTYTSSGNLKTTLIQKWNGTQWISNYMNTYLYDAQENLISALSQTGNGSVWINSWYSTFFYDSNGFLDSSIKARWLNNQWDNNVRYSYSYTPSGKVSTTVHEWWNGSQWSITTRLTFTYDLYSNLLSELEEQWDGTKWIISDGTGRYSYTYDSNGNMITELIEAFVDSVWLTHSETTFVYDAKNNMISEILELVTDSLLINYRQRTFIYNQNDNLTSCLTKIWVNSDWVNDSRTEYSYDLNGNMISGKAENWNGSQWERGYDYLGFYDSYGRYYEYDTPQIDVFYSIVTGFTDHSISVDYFNLNQNYPNPFNPSTTINYSIPQSSLVKLSVYDILGSKVAVLVNKEQASGDYKVEFNASTLSSGVYFYRLQSGSFVETKKLVLLR